MATKGETGLKTSVAKSKPKSAVKKKSAPKTVTAKKETTKVAYSQYSFGDSIQDEIILLSIIVASVVILISLFTSKMGAVGNGINSLLKGLFGIGGFLLPIVAISFCVWMLIDEQRESKLMKIIGGTIFLFACSVFFHGTGGNTYGSSKGFISTVTLLYQNGSGLNGGVIGGVIGNGMIFAFNKPITFLITIALMIISFMMVTGRSFFGDMSQVVFFINKHRKQRTHKIRIKSDGQPELKKEYRRPGRKEIQGETLIEKRKAKKGCFNIKIGEDEGKQDIDDDMPIVEAIDFSKRVKREKIKKQDTIYDFHKELENIVPHTPSEIDEIKYKVNNTIEELIKEEPIAEENSLPVVETNMSENADKDIIINMAEDNYHNKEELEVDLAKTVVKAALIGKEVNNSTESVRRRRVHNEKPVSEEKIGEKQSVVKNKQSQTNDDKLEKEEEEELVSELDTVPVVTEYQFPPIDLLGKNSYMASSDSRTEMMLNAKKLEETLKSFGVEAKVIQINKGPTVTRYELSPSQGVKVSKIVNLADDIALNLAASGIRIEAPIPGKAAVGIEVPNKEGQSVFLRDVLESDLFQNFHSRLAFALGKDIAGNSVVGDIADMPHLLIAGATGSGKSVCINTLIMSVIYKATPDEVKLILIDPKVVELSVYNGIPHLLIPVVTDPKKAAGALNWAVREMSSRYELFAEHGVRNLKGYNTMKKENGETDLMPQIVIVIDELADLMMAAAKEVEDSICRLAQLARAAGLHLIIATQRPSVDVITGLIKANVPSRLAFAVSSGTDSRTILDKVGAEKLLGKGDMLFYPRGMNEPIRVQGAFVTDKEVENIVEFLKNNGQSTYDKEMIEKITSANKNTDTGEDSDEFLDQAIQLVVEKEKASVSMLQRQFRIGYNRAARLVEDLEDRGIVGPEDGSKPRKVLMTKEEFEEYKDGSDE